ncbi:skin secretory protein xP2-like [Diceros bicornis minor]|uniref:skin secretory protein xP2-like n=1 Tax=Diceros bicornis minor TaxID=77932 RepID=UPI0026EA058B|nr:skin secretory protein xP2-like [Diceros bicornis minor]
MLGRGPAGTGPSGQGAAGEKTRSRENKFAPPGRRSGEPSRGAAATSAPVAPAPATPTPARAAGTPAPQRGTNPKSQRRKGKNRSPPPSTTQAAGPAPTRRGDTPAPAPAETEALPLASPLPHRRAGASPRTSPVPAASSPGDTASANRAAAADLYGGWSPRGGLCAAQRRSPGLRLPQCPAPAPAPRPLAISFQSPPDYISRQPSRLSRPPSRDTSRTGRQVGEPVGFPLAVAAAPRSDSPAAGAASPTLLGRGAAGPGAQSPGRDTPSPHHLQPGRPLSGSPSLCAAAGAPSPEWPRGPAPASRPRSRRPSP